MKEVILDLRNIEPEAGDTWADLPDRNTLENALLEYAGTVIRVKIFEVAPSRLEKG